MQSEEIYLKNTPSKKKVLTVLTNCMSGDKNRCMIYFDIRTFLQRIFYVTNKVSYIVFTFSHNVSKVVFARKYQ